MSVSIARTTDPTAERRKRVADLYDRGRLSTREIACREGVSDVTIAKDLRLMDVQLRPAGRGNLTAEEFEEKRRQAADLYDRGRGPQAIADELGVSRSFVWSAVKAAGVERRRPGAPRLYPEPEPRPCGRCGETFIPHRGRDRGRYCSRECTWQADERRQMASEAAAAQHQAVRERLERLKRENDLMEMRDVAAELGIQVSTVRLHYAGRGMLTTELREIDGHPVRLARRSDFEAFRREWARGAGRVPQRNRWLDPDFRVRNLTARGLDAKLAAATGVTVERARDMIRGDGERRRRAIAPYAGGRPKASAPPAFHVEWAKRFAALWTELTELHAAHHVEGDKPPTKLGVALLVAEDDCADHPERWDYSPADHPAEAARRVWSGVKPLLSPVTETPAP